MHFASDNWAGAAPEIVAAVVREGALFGAAYGDSEVDQAVARRFSEVFERDVAVFLVGTGSVSNALALTAFNRPGGVVFCHRESHIIADECGGVEFLTGGARLLGLDGAAGKIDPAALRAALTRFTPASVHSGQPMAVSLTQATEAGAVYEIDEIAALARMAKAAGLPVHMDGARFANALVALAVSPAEMTWKAGVDALSFGGTKNGCIGAEALVIFDPDRARDMPYLRKRAGQLFSKSRFIAAQFAAYLDDDLWLALARHANSMAERLRAGLSDARRTREAWPTRGNEIFAIMRSEDATRLRGAGASFHDWAMPHGAAVEIAKGEQLVRLVTSFATTDEDVMRFFAELAGTNENAPGEPGRDQHVA